MILYKGDDIWLPRAQNEIGTHLKENEVGSSFRWIFSAAETDKGSLPGFVEKWFCLKKINEHGLSET